MAGQLCFRHPWLSPWHQALQEAGKAKALGVVKANREVVPPPLVLVAAKLSQPSRQGQDMLGGTGTLL